MTSSKPWSSLALRLALSYGALMLLTMTIVLADFYVQTVGVVRVRLDKQAENHLRRLMEHSAKYGSGALESEILQTIRDGVNTDTEILILMDPDGEPIVSNAEVFPPRRLSIMGVRELTVKRGGRLVVGRVAVAEMPDGNLLAAGSDMQLQRDMEDLFGQASLLAAIAACVMAVLGALVFRRVVDERAAAIRSTMARVAAGDLRQRIPVDRRNDEFTLLNRDINTMLDRLEQLRLQLEEQRLIAAIHEALDAASLQLQGPLNLLQAAQRLEPEGSGHRAITAALTEGDRALMWLQDARPSQFKETPSRFELGQLLNDLQALNSQHEEAECQINVPAQPMQVEGQRLRLMMALQQLITLARQRLPDSDGIIRLSVRQAEQSVQLQLEDNGSLPEELLPGRVLPFNCLVQEESGTGIALSLVQGIVNDHSGVLSVTASELGGCLVLLEFSLTLDDRRSS